MEITVETRERLVSVIVACYNGEKYIDTCLQTLVNQTVGYYDIIVIDDGSTDESYEILKKWELMYPSLIKVFRKNNGGTASARNYGIRNTDAEYIMFVDVDDYVENRFVELLHAAVTASSADVCSCAYDWGRGSTWNNYEEKEGCIIVKENPDIICDIDVIVCNKIIKRNLFIENDIWFPEGMIYEDNATIPRLVAHSGKVSFIKKCLYHYVNQENSVMSNAQNRLNDYFKVLDVLNQDAMRFIYREQFDYINYSLMASFIGKTLLFRESREKIDLAYRYIFSNASNFKKNQCFKRHYALMNCKGKIYTICLLEQWRWILFFWQWIKTKK